MNSPRKYVGLERVKESGGASLNLSGKSSPAANCGGRLFKSHVCLTSVLGFKPEMSPPGSCV